MANNHLFQPVIPESLKCSNAHYVNTINGYYQPVVPTKYYIQQQSQLRYWPVIQYVQRPIYLQIPYQTVQYQYVQPFQQVRPVYQYQVRTVQKPVRYLQYQQPAQHQYINKVQYGGPVYRYQQKPIANARCGNYVRNPWNGNAYTFESYEPDDPNNDYFEYEPDDQNINYINGKPTYSIYDVNKQKRQKNYQPY